MAESSNQWRKDEAFQAMLSMGFEWEDIEVALDELLQFYDYKWNFIEANAYHLLVDRILNRTLAWPIDKRPQRDDQDQSRVLIPKPVAVSHLVRFKELKPLLMPFERSILGLEEEEKNDSEGNPPSPTAGAEYASISAMGLDVSFLARLFAQNPVSMPLERTDQYPTASSTCPEPGDNPPLLPIRPKDGKPFPIELLECMKYSPKRVKLRENVELPGEASSWCEGFADTRHLLSDSIPELPASPLPLGSSAHAGKISAAMQPASTDVTLQQVDPTGATNDQLSSRAESERSRADRERKGKGKQILGDSAEELESGALEAADETAKRSLDPRYADNSEENQLLRGRVERRSRSRSLGTSEPKVTKKYLSHLLISTRLSLSQGTFMESKASDSESAPSVSREGIFSPVNLVKIKLLVEDMTQGLESFMSSAFDSNLSSPSSPEVTANDLDLSSED